MSMHQSNQGCLDGLPGLPTELLMLIGEHLPNHGLIRFIRVNRRIYGVLIDLLCRRNIQHQRSSALPWAVRKNHVEVVCRLLRLGADVNTLDKGSYQRVNSAPSQEIGRTGFSRSEWTVTNYDPLLYHEVTSLFIAVWTRNLRLVKILLKAGAPVYYIRTELVRTCLWWATKCIMLRVSHYQHQWQRMIAMLVPNGCDDVM